MPELGALSLRIEATGGLTVLEQLKKIEAQAKITSQTAGQVQIMTAKGLQSFSVGAAKAPDTKLASAAIKNLNKEIAESTQLWSLMARTANIADAEMVKGIRQAAAAQLEWMKTVGASEAQQLRMVASVQQFEKRAGASGIAVTGMGRGVRSGASALAFLAISASTGSGSLRELATSAGLAATIFASEFATGKWVGYASGIGAVVIGVTALVGILREAAKARPVAEMALAHIGTLDRITETTEALKGVNDQIKAIQDRVDSGKGTGFFERMLHKRQPGVTMAQDFLDSFGLSSKDLRDLETLLAKREAIVKQSADVTLAETRATAAAAITVADQRGQADLDLTKERLAQRELANAASYTVGLKSLTTFYEQRRALTVGAMQEEEKTLKEERDRRARPVKGELPAARVQRLGEVDVMDAQLKAFGDRKDAAIAQSVADEAEERRKLAAKVLSYEATIEAQQDIGFQKRLQQIAAEAEERRRAVFQSTEGDAKAANAAADETIKRGRNALLLAKAQADISRLDTSLATQKLGIQDQLEAGTISEATASRDVAAAEQAAQVELQKLVTLALQFAAALGDQGALTALNQMQERFRTMGKDLHAIELEKNVAAGIADAISSGIFQGFAQGLGKGGIGEGMKGLTAQLLGGLGSVFAEVGAQALKGAILANTFTKALIANPVAAGIAAVALIALGSALGGSGGGSGGGSSFGGRSAPFPDSLRRVIIDPNAGLKQRVASSSRSSAVSQPAGPTIEVLGINTPRGQRLIGTSSNQFRNRGG